VIRAVVLVIAVPESASSSEDSLSIIYLQGLIEAYAYGHTERWK
jgi:hypothetical protein